VAYLNASPKSTQTTHPPASALARVRALPLAKQPQLKHRRLWGLGLGSCALGLVNGAVVISLGIGWVAYKQLLALSPRQWDQLRQQVEQALPLPRSVQQRALLLSLLLAASSFTMTSLWQATHSPLMGIVLLGQTTLTFFVVGLLLRTGISPATRSPRRRGEPLLQAQDSASVDTTLDPVEQNLSQLSHPDPLQRLVAVRRLVKRVDTSENDQLYAAEAGISLRSHLLDCFHMMLAHEPEPIVRTAVREGLELLRRPHQLPQGPLPFAPEAVMSTHTSRPAPDLSSPSHPQRPRSTVEYVEYLEP
jgi:hypothetical protein